MNKIQLFLGIALLISASFLKTYSKNGELDKLVVSKEIAYISPLDETAIDFFDNNEIEDNASFDDGLEEDDNEWSIKNKLNIEGMYKKNTNLLNSSNETDKEIAATHTLDSKFVYKYGNQTYGHDVVRFDVGVRTKGSWGAPQSFTSTAVRSIAYGSEVIGDHKHGIHVHLPIIREISLQLALNQALGWDFAHIHKLKLGLFPFQVGRGISLGSAYTNVPDFLGYDPASGVQQYAPGVLLSGELYSDDVLRYNFYASVSDNKSDSFSIVNENIRASMYGDFYDAARGFGKINYVLANNLIWKPCDSELCKIALEPYIVFINDREQSVEFVGDAEMKLGTFGLACDMRYGNFELSFEGALQKGKQNVYGIDRNFIKSEERDGIHTLVNSHVYTNGNNPSKLLYTKANQAAIDAQRKSTIKGERIADQFNNKGVGNGVNAGDRFRDPYENLFGGAMFVVDMAYNVPAWDLKLATAAGIASGDYNPNIDLDNVNDSRQDGTANMFQSYREAYSGSFVKSTFLMSGQSKQPLVLSLGSRDLNEGNASQVSRFTNLIYTGAGLVWDHETAERHWTITSNILSFWQDIPTRINSFTNASNHLGVEFNSTLEVLLLKNLTFFSVLGIFKPGQNYTDIKGRGLNRKQEAFLNQSNTTGDQSSQRVPVLGDDIAWFVNSGLQYTF